MLFSVARLGAVLATLVALGFCATPAASGSAGLAFSTFVGGSEYDAIGAIAVDGLGNTYVAGTTFSTDFPTTPGAYQEDFEPELRSPGFLVKFDPAGAVLYSTYLNLDYETDPTGIAVDELGNAYVTAVVESPAGTNSIVVKVNAAGSGLDYSRTILGGEQSGTFTSAIAIDEAGSAYVTGYTGSPSFKTTPGAFDRTFGGVTFDAFVLKLAPDGAVAYSTLLGGTEDEIGTGNDLGYSLAVDGDGAAYLTGFTAATDFPSTPGTLGPMFDGDDTFLTKLAPSGASLDYSTSLGDPPVSDLAVDALGSAYLTGTTASPPRDGFAAKVAPDASAYLYVTYLGGSGDDFASSIALGPGDRATVSGATGSADFPTTPDALDSTFNGGSTDAFATVLDATGSAFVFSTFLGGSGNDLAPFVALDATGNPSLAGTTASADFPTTLGADDGSGQFVTRLLLAAPAAGPCSQPGAIHGAGRIDGTPGNDIICGSPGPDTIDGAGGNDTIIGKSGVDALDGGPGDDTIRGGRGSDRLGGQAGDDNLDGGRGRDVVRGALGNDTVHGSDGHDTLSGGPGDDTCNGNLGTDQGQTCESYTSVEIIR